jgi:hypothetical protein
MHKIKFLYKLKHRKLILSTYMILKGGLISGGILILVPLPTKNASVKIPSEIKPPLDGTTK